MQTIIKDQKIINDNWNLVTEKEAATVPAGNIIIHLSLFLANAETYIERGNVSVWLDSDDSLETLAPYLPQLPVIAINFPKFTDGRGYSLARLLRERYQFNGEIRAIGEVLYDQLYPMQRCGFNAFELRHGEQAELALNAFSTFSTAYQASADEPLPVFRRA